MRTKKDDNHGMNININLKNTTYNNTEIINDNSINNTIDGNIDSYYAKIDHSITILMIILILQLEIL